MPSPATKRAHLVLETPDTTDTEPESDVEPVNGAEEERNSTDEMLDDSDDNEDLPPSLQVDFEARSPVDRDFHGIKIMLRKLFHHGNYTVNLNSLTQYIISQKRVGSVIVQAAPLDEGADGDDQNDDDNEELYNEVYGVSTVVRLDDPVLGKEIKGFLQTIVEKEGGTYPMTELIGNPANTVGMIVSERIISIPPQISFPLYQTLFDEIRRAASKNLPFKFTHYVMIIKMEKTNSKPAAEEQQVPIYDKAEEEIIVEESDNQYDLEKTSKDPVPQDFHFGKNIKVIVFSTAKIGNILNKLRIL